MTVTRMIRDHSDEDVDNPGNIDQVLDQARWRAAVGYVSVTSLSAASRTSAPRSCQTGVGYARAHETLQARQTQSPRYARRVRGGGGRRGAAPGGVLVGQLQFHPAGWVLRLGDLLQRKPLRAERRRNQGLGGAELERLRAQLRREGADH